MAQLRDAVSEPYTPRWRVSEAADRERARPAQTAPGGRPGPSEGEGLEADERFI